MSVERLAVLPAVLSLVVGWVLVAALAPPLTAEPRVGALAVGVLAVTGAAVACAIVVSRLGRGLQAEFARALQATEHGLRASAAQVDADRAEMASMLEHLADGVLVLNPAERIDFCNPAATRLLRQASLEGRPVVEVVHDGELVQVARSARASGPVTQVVELRPALGGPRCWVQAIASRLPSGQRTLLLLQDVTELRRAEAARRDFVANVSHELRTPVASLKALVETLEAGAIDDPTSSSDFLRRMHVEVDGLAHLVAELLDLARIEAGRLELDLTACRAQALVHDAIERIRPFGARVGLDVMVCPPEPGPELWALADAQRIGHVLSNLLANAVKFTPPGGRIEAGARARDGWIELRVADSGVGIAPDQLVRVFERFYKVDASRTGSGTGLGLAICKHLVRGHGGQIWAESDGLGRGATFRFTLPVAPTARRARRQPKDEESRHQQAEQVLETPPRPGQHAGARPRRIRHS